MKIRIMKNTESKMVRFIVNGCAYHTNFNGEGAWYGDDWCKQKIGTCDFRLTQKTRSGMRKAIIKAF